MDTRNHKEGEKELEVRKIVATCQVRDPRPPGGAEGEPCQLFFLSYWQQNSANAFEENAAEAVSGIHVVFFQVRPILGMCWACQFKETITAPCQSGMNLPTVAHKRLCMVNFASSALEFSCHAVGTGSMSLVPVNLPEMRFHAPAEPGIRLVLLGEWCRPQCCTMIWVLRRTRLLGQCKGAKNGHFLHNWWAIGTVSNLCHRDMAALSPVQSPPITKDKAKCNNYSLTPRKHQAKTTEYLCGHSWWITQTDFHLKRDALSDCITTLGSALLRCGLPRVNIKLQRAQRQMARRKGRMSFQTFCITRLQAQGMSLCRIRSAQSSRERRRNPYGWGYISCRAWLGLRAAVHYIFLKA